MPCYDALFEDVLCDDTLCDDALCDDALCDSALCDSNLCDSNLAMMPVMMPFFIVFVNVLFGSMVYGVFSRPRGPLVLCLFVFNMVVAPSLYLLGTDGVTDMFNLSRAA